MTPIFVLALSVSVALLMAWEIRRGLMDGKMRFQTGFVEREKSPIFFWSWFSFGIFAFVFSSALAIAGALAMLKGPA